MCGKDAGRGEGPNGTPSGGCPVGLPVEGSGGVSEKSFETRGVPDSVRGRPGE